MTSNNVIEELEAQAELSEADRVWMFIQLCNDDVLVPELKKQSMMQQMDIVPESLIHSFAYGVLRLAKPHLFDVH